MSAGPAVSPLAHIPNAIFHYLPTPGAGLHYGIQYTFAGVNLLIQYVGIGASANVFYRLYHGDEDETCRASLFTDPLGYDVNGNPVGCIATPLGLAILASHLAVDCLFGAMSILVVVASYRDESASEFVCNNCCTFVQHLLLLPVLLPTVLLWTLGLVCGFIDKTIERSRQTLCVIGGLGAAGLTTSRQELHHWFHTVQVLDVLFENTTEALISIWLFYVGYDSVATLIFFSPFLINVTYRLIYYLFTHCRDWCVDQRTAY